MKISHPVLLLLITGLVAENPTLAADAPPDEIMRIRDPFRRPDLPAETLVIRTELERYPAAEFRMVGVLTGPEKIRAMVIAPDGKTYFVAERVKIGQRNGVVRRITADSIQIREKIVNVLGQEESVDVELTLRPQ